MKIITWNFRGLFVIVACILLATTVSAQRNILKGDTLVLNNQSKFWINEELTFGSGTLPDGSYSYIYEAPNGLKKLVKDHKRKLLSPGFKSFKAKIVKFEKEIGRDKKDNDYTVLVLQVANGNRYWCDIANAFSNHEIVLTTSEKNGGATVSKSDPNKNDADFSKKKSLPDSKKTTSKTKPKPKPVPIF